MLIEFYSMFILILFLAAGFMLISEEDVSFSEILVYLSSLGNYYPHSFETKEFDRIRSQTSIYMLGHNEIMHRLFGENQNCYKYTVIRIHIAIGLMKLF